MSTSPLPSFGASAVPASGATKPYKGAVNRAVKAACVPMVVSARKSAPKRRIRSPTQVHSPAITPVSPASGPIDPPNSSGRSAASESLPMPS